VSASANYDFARYSTPEIPRRNLISLGLGGSYQVSKWIYLTSQYYHYLNDVDPRFRNTNIDSLQIGGVSIKAGHGWVIGLSGGADSTKAAGRRLVTGSGQASIAKASRRTNVEFGYRRGYTTVFPLPEVGYGDIASLQFVQFLTRRIAFRGSSSFI